jgi:hypothetical protein
MENVVILQWVYSPPNFFEDPFAIRRNEYEITIENGKVAAKMSPEFYKSNSRIQDEIKGALENLFRGAELFSHKAADLKYDCMLEQHEDGYKDFYDTLTEHMRAGEVVDFVLKNQDGKVAGDSRRERIEKLQELAELAQRIGEKDLLAKSLLASYHNSLLDPGNELVHLYEIRDAIAKNFGGEKQACTSLTISSREWSELGRVANNEPLKQGRHRGKFIENLRDATQEELLETRAIAQAIVIAYLHYSDTHPSQTTETK